MLTQADTFISLERPHPGAFTRASIGKGAYRVGDLPRPAFWRHESALTLTGEELDMAQQAIAQPDPEVPIFEDIHDAVATKLADGDALGVSEVDYLVRHAARSETVVLFTSIGLMRASDSALERIVKGVAKVHRKAGGAAVASLLETGQKGFSQGGISLSGPDVEHGLDHLVLRTNRIATAESMVRAIAHSMLGEAVEYPH